MYVIYIYIYKCIYLPISFESFLSNGRLRHRTGLSIQLWITGLCQYGVKQNEITCNVYNVKIINFQKPLGHSSFK